VIHDCIFTCILFTENTAANSALWPCQIIGALVLMGIIIMTIITWTWSRHNFVSRNNGGFSAVGWFLMGKTYKSNTV